jgi:hypothetical protein
MTSVHDVTYDRLRGHGVTTIFGNPGLNEVAVSERVSGRLPIFPRPARGNRCTGSAGTGVCGRTWCRRCSGSEFKVVR